MRAAWQGDGGFSSKGSPIGHEQRAGDIAELQTGPGDESCANDSHPGEAFVAGQMSRGNPGDNRRRYDGEDFEPATEKRAYKNESCREQDQKGPQM